MCKTMTDLCIYNVQHFSAFIIINFYYDYYTVLSELHYVL